MTTTRKRPPYKPGDHISGFGHGTSLTEGTVTACEWNERRGNWDVIARMLESLVLGEDGGTFTQTYLWVKSNGESDFCSPGRIYQCRYDSRAEHREHCPHSDGARKAAVDALAFFRKLGYSVKLPADHGDELVLRASGYDVRFELMFRWDPYTERMQMTAGTRTVPGGATTRFRRFPLAAQYAETDSSA